MKTASAGLIAFLNATTAGMMRHLITVTPRSGSAVRWTDHATDISYGGNVYYAGGDGTTHPVVIVGGHEQSIGLEIATCTLTLLCGEDDATFNSVYLPQAALAGTLDGAWVKIERVFGSSSIDTSLGVLHVFEGPVGVVTPSDHSVELEVESGTALLRVPMPRVVFQPGCTAAVYDGQCGLTRASFTDTYECASYSSTTVVRSNCTKETGTTNTQGWYALGVLTFTSGPNAGLSRGIRSYTKTNGAFTLDRPLPVSYDGGDFFTVYPGCPKTLTACSNNTATAGPQFNNKTHFRGFPYVPSNESGG